MFLDLLGRAGSGSDLFVVTARHRDQGCIAVCLLVVADRRPGFLSKQAELVRKSLFDKKNLGAQGEFVFLDAGC